MKRKISNLWLLVLFGLLATVAACAGSDKSSTGPVNTTPQVAPTRASPTLPAVTPTQTTPQGATGTEGSILARIVENYGAAPSTNPDTSSPETKGVSRNPVSPLPVKFRFSEAVGKTAPDFTIESLRDGNIKLSSYRGKNVVLFFTEGTMCYPACWDQMARFGSDERFNNKDIAILSIGVNARSEWEKIVSQVPQLAKAPILLDTTKAVSLTYDVLSLRSSMHSGDLPGHTYFIVDREGIIRFAFDDPDMGIRNDRLAEELKKLAP